MNKWLKFFLLGLLGVVVILNVYIISTSQFYIYKALYYNFADIDDYKIFPNREIAPADQPEEWKISSFYNKVSLPEETEKLLADIESIAFLVIKDDSILIEKYWQGYSDSSLSGSFS
ncbi:MAG TPA: serine hydrolase, partial [Cytophagaceae bacterium]